MASHLTGKKHKHRTMRSATAMYVGAARRSKSHAPVAAIRGADQVQQANGAKKVEADKEAGPAPLVAPQDGNAADVMPVEGDGPAEVDAEPVAPIKALEDGMVVEEAEGELTAVTANGGSKTRVEEPGEADDITAGRGRTVKVQLEGNKIFMVPQLEDGSFLCEACGVRGCDKDGMLLHLYRAHMDTASFAGKEQACAGVGAVAAEEDKVGESNKLTGEATV